MKVIKNIYFDNNRIIGHIRVVIFLKRGASTTVHKYRIKHSFNNNAEKAGIYPWTEK